MSIYATLWTLKFPHQRVGYPDCDWIRVSTQRALRTSVPRRSQADP